MTKLGVGRPIRAEVHSFNRGTQVRRFGRLRCAADERMIAAARKRTMEGARQLGRALRAQGFDFSDPVLGTRHS